MANQLAGAASALVLFLAWMVVVECLMAAVVLLGEFIMLRLRAVRSMVPSRSPEPAPEVQPQEAEERYRIGGGLMGW